MTETTPSEKTPLQPRPLLVPLSLTPFRVLLWFGLLTVPGYWVAIFMYANLDADDLQGMWLWAALTVGTMISGAVFIAGAGIIAGLGKRQPPETDTSETD